MPAKILWFFGMTFVIFSHCRWWSHNHFFGIIKDFVLFERIQQCNVNVGSICRVLFPNKPVHNRPLTTDHAHNTFFNNWPIHSRPWSWQTTFTTDHVHNRLCS